MSLLEQLRGSRTATQSRGCAATLASGVSLQNPLMIPGAAPGPCSPTGSLYEDWQGAHLALQTGCRPGWQSYTQASGKGLCQLGVRSSTVRETANQTQVDPNARNKRRQHVPDVFQETGMDSNAKPSTDTPLRWLRGESVPPAVLTQLQPLPERLQGQSQVICNRATQASPSSPLSHSPADRLAADGSSIKQPCSALPSQGNARASLQERAKAILAKTASVPLTFSGHFPSSQASHISFLLSAPSFPPGASFLPKGGFPWRSTSDAKPPEHIPQQNNQPHQQLLTTGNSGELGGFRIAPRCLMKESAHRRALAAHIKQRLHHIAQQCSEVEAMEQNLMQLMEILYSSHDNSVPLADQERVIMQVVRDMSSMKRTAPPGVVMMRARLAELPYQDGWSASKGISALQRTLRAWAEGKEASVSQRLSVGVTPLDNPTSLQRIAWMSEDDYCNIHIQYQQAIGELLPEARNAGVPTSSAAQQQAVALLLELLSLCASYALGRSLSMHSLCKHQATMAATTTNFNSHIKRLMEIANLSEAQLMGLWQLWHVRCQSINVLRAQEALLRGQFPAAVAAAAKADRSQIPSPGKAEAYSNLLQLVSSLHANYEEQVAVSLLCNIQAMLQYLEPRQVTAMCACAGPFHLSLELLFSTPAVSRQPTSDLESQWH